MLGMKGLKGSVLPGADADLVVLEEVQGVDNFPRLEVQEVWKFGERVYRVEK